MSIFHPSNLGRSLRFEVKRGALMATFVALYLLAAGYLLPIRGIGNDPSLFLAIIFQVVVIACYGVLWLLLQDLFCQEQPSPIQAFWHLLVGAAVYAALFFAAVNFIPGGFNEDGLPVAITTAVQSALIAPIAVGFAMLIMLRLRELLLYKRTLATIRSWRWLIGLMALNAAAAAVFDAIGSSPLETPIRVVIAVPLVIFVAINAFRVSWVVRLSATQKTLTILAAIALAMFCGLTSSGLDDLTIAIGGAESLTKTAAYVEFYSDGLLKFVNSVGFFGVIYCLTSILSLIFHLPTTSDFQRREGERAAIFSLTDLVKEVSDLNKLVHAIVTSAAEAHSATVTWLAMPDPDSRLLDARVVAAHNMTTDVVESSINLEGFYDEAALAQETLYLDHALADRRVLAQSGEGIASLVVVPLAANRRVLGVLFVAKNVARGFDKDDIRAINAFAAQAALALDNARLLETQFERARLARELAIAREVQQRLLPQRMPEYRHIDIAAASVSAHEVGGDYFDYVELDEHHLAFIVSDVSGKGTSAAFYMAGMQGIFRSVTRITPDPKTFLAHANHVLGELLERNVFISVIYGIVDHQRHEITLARAGHCPAIATRRGSHAEFIRPDGLGIGLVRGNRFRDTLEVATLSMKPGDAAVFYTDGVVESRNAGGEEYGYERLLNTVETFRHASAAELHAAVLDDLHQFMGTERRYDDDMTLLVFKWRGPGLAGTGVPLSA